ncbi:MAG: GNAT family N-acetyltransferase [Parachlamydiales bacterium]|nr:GNAT family N-acetyltransferase [Parachlamydiales bacterium]
MSQKFILRKFKKDDGVGLYHALLDERVIRHMAFERVTLENSIVIVNDAIDHWNRYNIGSYAVIDSKTNKLIGWAGFKALNGDFELLIVISSNYWGIGKKIYDELINKAKNEFFLEKIYLFLPITRKSFKYIEKLGFKECGQEMYNGILFKKFIKKLS